MEVKKRVGLSSFGIKLIAIIAMTIDHLAWADVPFMSVKGQVMHVIGRLTIPIMCFCLVEGYFHTKNVKKYAIRLLMFGIISAIPFYMFFGEMYVYRQNIIIDYLFALLVLMIKGDQSINKHTRRIAIFAIIISSFLVGGWPIMPIVYVYIFYTCRGDFKKICALFAGATVLLVAFTILFSVLNEQLHFSEYEWDRYEKLYLLGFVLALPIIRLYNGHKGADKIGSGLFYVYYPAHFIILALAFNKVSDTQMVFILLQVAAMVLIVTLIVLVAVDKPAGNASTIAMLSFGLLYMGGYLLELTNPTLESVKSAVKLEYLANCGYMICFTWFVSDFIRLKLPAIIYWAEGIVSAFVVVLIYLMDSNDLFYKSFDVGGDLAFPVAIIEPGIGYYCFYGFMVAIYVSLVVACYIKSKRAAYIEQKRIMSVVYGILAMWFFIALKSFDISSYDLIPFAVLSGLICVTYGALRYGYGNSAIVVANNAINYSRESMIVMDMSGEVLMMNENSKILFPHLSVGKYVTSQDGINEIIRGNKQYLEKDDAVYELRKQPIYEESVMSGYIVWAIDMTNHVETLNQIKNKAERDGLTGLFNREYFENIVKTALSENEKGTMFMMDLDNFKHVNDHYGHNTGDGVLIAFAEHMKECFKDTNATITRLGGDEFTVYVPDVIDENKIKDIAKNIIKGLSRKMTQSGLPSIVGTSVGICINNGTEFDYDKFYKKTDNALYYSKEHGKNDYKISEE